jgi:hypothetical protein
MAELSYDLVDKQNWLQPGQMAHEKHGHRLLPAMNILLIETLL